MYTSHAYPNTPYVVVSGHDPDGLIQLHAGGSPHLRQCRNLGTVQAPGRQGVIGV